MSIDSIGMDAALAATHLTQQNSAPSLETRLSAFVGRQIEGLSLSPDRRDAFHGAWSANNQDLEAPADFADELLAAYPPADIGEEGRLLQSAAAFEEAVSVHLAVHQLSAPSDALSPIADALNLAGQTRGAIDGAEQVSTFLSEAAERLSQAD